jgi:hypothetical protein
VKRDMDLVREILLEIYNHEDDSLPELKLKDHPPVKVMYHVKMLKDIGLIEAIDASSSGGMYFLNLSLTWDGHDFIEVAKIDTHWERAKTTVMQTVGVLTVEALKIVLKELVTKPFIGM